jgi:hypothetical protein
MFAIMPAGKRANAKEETMEKIIGACGNDCGDCEAYKATQANDAGAIARVAEQWSKEYSADIKPEYVWCDACMTDGARKCGHCAECDIRACVVSRSLANCAGCDDYACERITKFFESFPCAKGRLDEVRAARQP